MNRQTNRQKDKQKKKQTDRKTKYDKRNINLVKLGGKSKQLHINITDIKNIDRQPLLQLSYLHIDSEK